jgi:hypothetical protein
MKDISREQLKSEIQGSGFLADVKERHLPDSSEMTELALGEYEERHGPLTAADVKQQFSYILEQLLEIEKELYAEYEKDVYRNALVYFLEDSYAVDGTDAKTSYPETHRVMKEIEDIYTGDGDFIQDLGEILPLLYPIFDDISVSASQARRKRAGISLNNHIETVLGELPYSIGGKSQRGNCRKYTITTDHGNSANPISLLMGFHTSLSDRYRQTLSEETDEDKGIPKYMATASGRGIISDDDRTDITVNKIDDIYSHGFKLVAFKNVKSEFRNHEGIISYESFASRELPQVIQG